MAASELFLDANDASFRLADTWIMIGRRPFGVEEVRALYPNTLTPKASTEIIGQFWNPQSPDGMGSLYKFTLERLSMLTMFACPRGYYRNIWFSRGPTRSRFQGLKRSSLWGLTRFAEYVGAPQEINLGKLLYGLAEQPKIYTGQAGPGKTRTRDVRISEDSVVLFRGLPVGNYLGYNKMKVFHDYLSSEQLSSLGNANLRIV